MARRPSQEHDCMESLEIRPMHIPSAIKLRNAFGTCALIPCALCNKKIFRTHVHCLLGRSLRLLHFFHIRSQIRDSFSKTALLLQTNAIIIHSCMAQAERMSHRQGNIRKRLAEAAEADAERSRPAGRRAAPWPQAARKRRLSVSAAMGHLLRAVEHAERRGETGGFVYHSRQI
mgnify:CR=1 FL=1